MADNVIVDQPVETQVQPDFKAELDQMMAISLGQAPPTQQVDAPQVDATQTQQQTTEAAQTTTQEPAVQNQPPVQSTPDSFSVFKEKFGFENTETVVKEIERLRALETAPPELVFDNEESATILKALSKGDRKPLYEYLHREAQIDRLMTGEVTRDNAAEIVKMKMQLANKDLTPSEIEYRFKKQFGVPPKPERGTDEEEEDYNSRMAQWQEVANDREMDLVIEAKIGRPELSKAKGNLSVPQIDSPIDEGYAQYQQMLAQQAVDDKATKEAYKALTTKSVETKIHFKDEANKINFEFQYEPDAQSFSRAQEIACDADLFWKTFINSDGTPNRQLFLESILYALDKNKIIMSAMNQAKNATIKASLPDNSQGGIVKQIAQHQEPSELDAQMRNSLRGYGGY